MEHSGKSVGQHPAHRRRPGPSLVLLLPPTARKPFRLDLGNRPAYVEIEAIELVAGQDGDGARSSRILGRWSAVVREVNVILISGVTPCPGRRCTGFTYILSSNGQTAVGRVTFTVTGKVWFINNNAGACPSICNGRHARGRTRLSAPWR